MTMTVYENYDRNQRLIEAFMALAHQQYFRSYHADILHTGNSITNLKDGNVYYVAFDLGGQGIYSQWHEGLPDRETELKICHDLYRYARGLVYRFVGGEETYELIEQYEYR